MKSTANNYDTDCRWGTARIGRGWRERGRAGERRIHIIPAIRAFYSSFCRSPFAPLRFSFVSFRLFASFFSYLPSAVPKNNFLRGNCTFPVPRRLFLHRSADRRSIYSKGTGRHNAWWIHGRPILPVSRPPGIHFAGEIISAIAHSNRDSMEKRVDRDSNRLAWIVTMRSWLGRIEFQQLFRSVETCDGFERIWPMHAFSLN